MSSCVSRGSATHHAITPSAAAAAASSTSRGYQRLLSKHRMNVSRYSVSGTIHRSGTAAMFCVMWLVTVSSRTLPVAASASHSMLARQEGGLPIASASVASAAGATPDVRPLRHAIAAHSSAKTA